MKTLRTLPDGHSVENRTQYISNTCQMRCQKNYLQYMK